MNPVEMEEEQVLRPEDAELVASLMGATASQLHNIDKDIVSRSPNIQGLRFNPKTMLKNTLATARGGQPPQPIRAPVQHAPIPAPVEQVHFHSETGVEVPVPPPSHFGVVGAAPIQVQQYQAPPQVVIMDTKTVEAFNSRIAALEGTLNILIDHVVLLRSLEEKFMEVMERSLKKGLSTITLKLQNEPSVKEQKELHQQLSNSD